MQNPNNVFLKFNSEIVLEKKHYVLPYQRDLRDIKCQQNPHYIVLIKLNREIVGISNIRKASLCFPLFKKRESRENITVFSLNKEIVCISYRSKILTMISLCLINKLHVYLSYNQKRYKTYPDTVLSVEITPAT